MLATNMNVSCESHTVSASNQAWAHDVMTIYPLWSHEAADYRECLLFVYVFDCFSWWKLKSDNVIYTAQATA